MLNVEPENLLLEAEAAIAVRDIQLRELKNITGIFTGPYSHAKGGEHWSDNFISQYLTYALPKTGYNNPRFRVRTPQSAPRKTVELLKQNAAKLQQAMMAGAIDPVMGQMVIQRAQTAIEQIRKPGLVAEGMQWAINQWISANDSDDDILHFVENCLTFYGVLKTVQVKSRDGRKPRWDSVSPSRFGFDPLTLMFGGARYVFEQIIADKEDMIARAEADSSLKWNVAAIKGLGEDSEPETVRGGANDGGVPARGEVAYIEFWVREDLPESYGPYEGFHGTIYTVAKGSGEYLREPVPYYGPPWGPYCLGGVYPVMDCPYPLSPVMVNYAQARDHNDQVRAAMVGAKNYKRIVFVPAGQPNAKKAMEEAPHDFIVQLKGLKKDEVIAIEVGGISDQQLKQVAFTRELLRRGSGMTENAVGSPEGGGVGNSTATEAAIIDEGAQTRIAFVQQRISKSICQAGRSAAWFIWHDKKTKISLGDDAAESLGMIWPTFEGGKNADDGAEFYDLGFNVDVMSMPWSGQNQEKQNAVMLLDQIVKVAPLVQTVPAIDWGDALNRVGDSFNESDLGDIIDDEVVQQQQAMQQQAQQMEMQNGQAGAAQGNQEAAQKSALNDEKRKSMVADRQNKGMVARATVKEKQLKGKSYGQKAKASKR